MCASSPTFLNKPITPEDLKNLSIIELEILSKEIRDEIIKVVTVNGGHLASSLGAVELIVALHHVFDSPKDKIIFDVGHQAYAHKIITGRLNEFGTLRLSNGLSGFPRREESPSDIFNTGHSSTSISAALGLAITRDLEGLDNNVIAVIGDGALTGGMALEAMNHAGGLNKNLLVVFNDNKMSISPNVGAISQYLSLKLSSHEHIIFREKVKSTLQKFMPHRGGRIIRRLQGAEEALKSFLISPRSFLAVWGFKYLGPIDGHDLKKLTEVLKHIKLLNRPVFLHVMTTKGKGYIPAETDPLLFHGLGTSKVLSKIDPSSISTKETGIETYIPYSPSSSSTSSSNADNILKLDQNSSHLKTQIPLSTPKSYTSVFGEFMVKEGEKNEKLVAITAAMSQGTGLSEFFLKYPNRSFDVGIAEQHAVTLAAAIAVGGFRPVVAIYSTFLQRAFDQLYHDVALQKLPVLFAIDRAGLVGEDGPTHHGALDLSYLRLLPEFTVMAPKDQEEFTQMLKFALNLQGPSAIRYPRGQVIERPSGYLNTNKTPLELGKAELLLEGKDLLIISIGHPVFLCYEAAISLKNEGIDVSLINTRFISPLDKDLILKEANKSKRVLTVEENCLVGGLKSAIAELLLTEAQGPICFASVGMPITPIPHASQDKQRASIFLSVEGIKEKCLSLLRNKTD